MPILIAIPITTVSAPIKQDDTIVIINVIPLQLYAIKESKSYGVDPHIIDKVITCESNWRNIQSNLYNKYRGHREMSFGIAQINLISHPEITKKDALNERFSIRYMVSEIAKGRGSQWTCYRELF